MNAYLAATAGAQAFERSAGSRPGMERQHQPQLGRPHLPVRSGDTPAIIQRNLPDAQRAMGLDYDGNLERRWALAGHHGVYVRGLAFGQAWARA